MALRIAIKCFFFFISIEAISQDNDSIRWNITKFQHVVFLTSDTIYNYTRFIKPDGTFYFLSGFINSTYNDEECRLIPTKGKVIKQIEKFEYIPDEIDTIKLIFPINNLEINEVTITDSLIHNVHMIESSYILDQLGEPDIGKSKQNIIRVLEPWNEINFCKYYHVFTIKLFADSSMLYVTFGRSINYNGIQVIRKDSTLLSKKSMKYLIRHLNTINGIENNECINSSNPLIIEYINKNDYKRFVFSYNCLQENHFSDKKVFIPLWRFYSSVLYLSQKNFDLRIKDFLPTSQ